MGGLVCVPADLACYALERKRCGRRGAMAGGLWLSGVCLFLGNIADEVYHIAFYYVGTSAMSVSFAIMYIWASELFPTDMQGVSFGILSLCGGLGAVSTFSMMSGLYQAS